jgi:hypothetical protein
VPVEERLEELGSAKVAVETGSIGEVWLRRMLQNSSSSRAKVIWMVELALLPLCCSSPERDADDSDYWISSTACIAIDFVAWDSNIILSLTSSKAVESHRRITSSAESNGVLLSSGGSIKEQNKLFVFFFSSGKSGRFVVLFGVDK